MNFKKGDRVKLIVSDMGMPPETILIIDEDDSMYPYVIKESDGEKTCITAKNAILITKDYNFQVGDIIRAITSDYHDITSLKNEWVGRVTRIYDDTFRAVTLSSNCDMEKGKEWSCLKYKYFEIRKIIKNNADKCECECDIEGKEKSFMSKVLTFVKNATLSSDQKLLRKYGLQDECGNVTEEGKEAILLNFFNNSDNQAYLLIIAQGLDAEAAKNNK